MTPKTTLQNLSYILASCALYALIALGMTGCGFVDDEAGFDDDLVGAYSVTYQASEATDACGGALEALEFGMIEGLTLSREDTSAGPYMALHLCATDPASCSADTSVAQLLFQQPSTSLWRARQRSVTRTDDGQCILTETEARLVPTATGGVELETTRTSGAIDVATPALCTLDQINANRNAMICVQTSTFQGQRLEE